MGTKGGPRTDASRPRALVAPGPGGRALRGGQRRGEPLRRRRRPRGAPRSGPRSSSASGPARPRRVTGDRHRRRRRPCADRRAGFPTGRGSCRSCSTTTPARCPPCCGRWATPRRGTPPCPPGALHQPGRARARGRQGVAAGVADGVPRGADPRRRATASSTAPRGCRSWSCAAGPTRSAPFTTRVCTGAHSCAPSRAASASCAAPSTASPGTSTARSRACPARGTSPTSTPPPSACPRRAWGGGAGSCS